MSNKMQPPPGERPADAGKRSLVHRILDAIFGYDFFISYTRRDGGKDYAEALAGRLKGAGFQIFFDSDEYAMGDDWKVEGRWALRRKQLDVEPYSVESFSPDGRYLASVGVDAAHLWDLSDPNGPREVSRFVEDARFVRFSPDGKWLISGHRDGTMSKRPVLAGQEIARLEHDDEVNTLAFSPDGRRLATASKDRTLRVFNVNDWTPIETPKLGVKHPAPIAAITYSPDGRWLVTISDHIVRLFDHQTLLINGTLEHKNVVDELGFSPDGKFVMTRTVRTVNNRGVSLREGSVRVWSTENFQEVASRVDAKVNTTEDPAETSGAPAADQTAMLSNAMTWPKFLMADSQLRRYRPELRSPDGRWIARVIEIDSSELSLAEFAHPDHEVNRFRHNAKVTDVAFSVDSRWLASASGDHTVRIWALKTEDLIEQACARLPRNLSREEWNNYMGDEPYSPTCPKLPVPGK